METSAFQTWLDRGPHASDVEALRGLVNRYPYAGALRLLLAKSAELAQDLERREDLLRAGAHVPSRRVLFAYLMGPGLVAEAQSIHEEILSLPEVSEAEMVAMVWHNQDGPIAEAPSEKVPEERDETPELASREAMVAAIASVIEHDVDSWNHAEPEEPQDGAANEGLSAGAQAGVDVPELNPEAQPLSVFGQWLQQRARETGFGKAHVVEQGAAALIDAFLAKGDVRIGPVRDSLESTEKWASQGLVEDPSLVTETMAKLYAQQGQIGRARKAYKLLALKYPEKSVYFAAQLKKLRNS